MKKFSIHTVLLLVLVNLHNMTIAQPPVSEAMKASRELSQLRRVLSDTTHLSFTALYCFEHIDSVTVRDTMQLQYQISKNKYRIVTGDSLEVVQNDYYNLALYHDRDMVVLSRPKELVKYLFNASLMDTTFYRQYINKVVASDTGSYRKLSYQFKPGSPFEKYEILYSPTTYRIHQLHYQIRKNPPGTSLPAGNARYCAKIWFSNYQTGAFTDQVFSTDPYFISSEGQYQLAAPYNQYELINTLNQ